MQTAEYRADTVIFEEGSVADAFYLIMSGKVEVTTASKGRLRALVKGDYFGELALLHNEPRAATVMAKTEVPGPFFDFFMLFLGQVPRL